MASGVYEVRPRGQNDGVVVNAYCDMSTTPAGQSLFDVPDGQAPGLVGSSKCVWSQSFSLTADTTMMWVDFTGKQYGHNSNIAYAATWGNAWWTLGRDSGSDLTAVAANGRLDSASTGYQSTAATHTPTSVNWYGRPIPMPGSGVSGGTVVWLDSTNKIAFKVGGTQYAFDYPTDFPSQCRPTASWSADSNKFYITDGINNIGVGVRGNSDASTITNYAILTIDWSASPYSAAMFTASVVDVSAVALTGAGDGVTSFKWHHSASDHMNGDLLWTVKGKPSWYANYGAGAGGGRLFLGTSLRAPWTVTEKGTPFTPTAVNAYAGASGLDLFTRVDSGGTLWLGDWGRYGDQGGVFQCPTTSTNQLKLGVQATNIKLAVPPPLRRRLRQHLRHPLLSHPLRHLRCRRPTPPTSSSPSRHVWRERSMISISPGTRPASRTFSMSRALEPSTSC